MIIAGTRPELIKVAPIIHAIREDHRAELIFVHSGQHYDSNMSNVFINELGLPQPDANLEVGSGSHSEQTARMLLRYEKAIKKYSPDLVLAEGDTNTVAAVGLTAVKLRVPFGHVEAGLRNYDKTMPEEVNRVVADACSELCFAPTSRAALNLCYEGTSPRKIHITGNTIVDACLKYVKIARVKSKILKKLELHGKKPLVTVTAHRAENVDNKEKLTAIVNALVKLEGCRIVFPIHPRTVRNLKSFSLWRQLNRSGNIVLTEPMGYFDFLALLDNSAFALTDSGGIQEESVTLHVPCLTMRQSTERPETVEVGANILVGADEERIIRYANRILEDEKFAEKMRNTSNPLGDGCAGERIAKISMEKCEEGFHLEAPSFLDVGSASFRTFDVDSRIAGKAVCEVRGSNPHALITLLYDANGRPLYPYPELKLRKGWRIRVFGSPHEFERLYGGDQNE